MEDLSKKYDERTLKLIIETLLDSGLEYDTEFDDSMCDEIVEDSAKLNSSTLFFSKISDIIKDIPALRQFSSPFEAAAKAAGNRPGAMFVPPALFSSGLIAI